MISTFTPKLFCAVAAAGGVAIATLGCGSGTSTGTRDSKPEATIQNSVTRSADGNVYVRAEGWTIPGFGAAEREEFETLIPTSEGQSVKVLRTVIRTDPHSIYIDNPLHLVGLASEKIRLNTVNEYRTAKGIFCYKFKVNEAEFDEKTNEVLSTRGLLYPYSIYDEDGDGVFESLVLKEAKDRFNHQGFEAEPHIPEWARGK